MSQEEPITVNHVTNLVRALNNFRPVLVNEKWTGRYEWNASAPNIHQLVNIAFAATGAIKKFIEERDIMERNHNNLMTETMLCVAEFQNEHLKSKSILEGVQTLIGQKHQCFDVLDKIFSLTVASKTQDEKVVLIHEIIETFRGRWQKPIEKIDGPANGAKDQGSCNGNTIPFTPDMGTREPNA